METNDLNGKLVNFKTKDGLTLHGFIAKSKPNNKKIIIEVHGMTGNFFDFSLMQHLAHALHKSNYDLFLANNRGFGIKTRFRKGKKKLYIGTAFEKFEECIQDIDAAINAAEKIGYKKIILSGHSTGCQKITYYQAKRQNKKIKGLILLAPASDYELAKTKLGKKFATAVRTAKKLIKKGKGDTVIPKYTGEFSVKRFMSYANPKNPEGEAFNYSGKLAQFSKIKEPILAIFGSKEEHTAQYTPKQMLKVLQNKSNSKMLITAEIKGVNHGFRGKEKETAKVIKDFLKLIN